MIKSIAIVLTFTFGLSLNFAAQGESVADATSDNASSSTIADAATEGAVSEDAKEKDAPELGFVQTLKQKYIEGDVLWMTPVLICLIIGMALSIERVVYLNLATINTDKFKGDIEAALQSGGVEAAKEVARNTRGPIASIYFTLR